MFRNVLILSLVFSCFGCVSIPPVPYVVSGWGSAGDVRMAADCDTGGLAASVKPGELHRQGLDPAGFTLFNWNVMKGSREGWREDLALQARDADLLTLQETHFTGDLRAALEEGRYRWDMAASFLYRGKETGVLTGSSVDPSYSCVTRFIEPLVAMPKTVLASLYPLTGTDRQLLVVNVHLINFTGAGGEYRRQLDSLEGLLAGHEGPLIVAGDFNTWSGGRLDVVAAMAERLGLEEVLFTEGSPAAFFGRLVDHVFYRDLELRRARAVKVATSDHHPLLVEFRLAEGERGH